MRVKKDLVIALSVCALGFMLVVSLPRLAHVYDLRRLNSVDQRALLQACRGLITQYSVTDPMTQEMTVPPEKYSHELKDLRPAMVSVSTNHVYIVLRAGLGHFAVYAFADGQPQYGERTATDGLRYTYDPSREYQEMVKARKPRQSPAGDVLGAAPEE
jgi:hypothetical protein